MATYTTNGGIKKIATGDESGTWGTSTNANFDIIDRLAVGVGSIALSGTTHTLTTSDGSTSDGQYHVLVLGGSPSGTNTITVSPNDTARLYVVKNNSGQTATFTQGSGANVSVSNGKSAIIYCDGAGSGAAVVDITSTFVGTTTLSDLGVTATAAELNYNDITTLGTVEASKTVTANSSGNVNFGDQKLLTFGAGSDLTIKHTGSHSYITDSGTGNLYIQASDQLRLQSAAGENHIVAQADADVAIFHDNAQRITTTTKGADITGDGTSEAIMRIDTNSNDKGDYRIRVADGATYGIMYFEDFAGASWTPNLALQSNGEVYFYEDGGSTVKYYWDSVNETTLHKDNVKAVFGDSADLEIYHDGTNSNIKDVGSGFLSIDTNGTDIRFTSGSQAKIMAYFAKDSAAYLYHNGNQKFSTASTGADLVGTLTTDGVTVDGTLDIEEVYEKVALDGGTSGTINFDTTTQGIAYFVNNQTGNRTINFSNVNSNLAAGQSVTCTLLMNQGSTPYYLSVYQVDGSAVTPKWSGGSAPTAGNASSIDVYTFTIIKTADATFTVLASQTQFA